MYKKAKKKNEEKINKRLFYNQVSLIINNGNDTFNVKVFSNGSLQITGCKDEKDGKRIIEIIKRNVEKMKDKVEFLTIIKDENDIYKDIEDNIYYYDKEWYYLGYKVNGKYKINNKEYNVKEINGMKYFELNSSDISKKKEYLNMFGEYIGTSNIKMFKNKKKLFTNNKNIIIENDLIFSGEILIGEIKYNFIHHDKEYQNFDMQILETNLVLNPLILNNNLFDIDNYEVVINTINVYYNINKKLNRDDIYKKFINLGYVCKFNPEIYAGIKLTFKINDANLNELEGKCNCEMKCICDNITFLIFQTGNIIVTGFKNIALIENVINKIDIYFK
jgi:TATA-box binding protein (TBP) (component of TFIID and TFIIIB)